MFIKQFFQTLGFKELGSDWGKVHTINKDVSYTLRTLAWWMDGWMDGWMLNGTSALRLFSAKLG